jgi:hypothetical protein
MVKTPSFKRLILRAVLRQVSPMVIRLVSAARGPSFVADQDEGPQRGSERPIPPLVSKIQVATTNAGARAQGGLTPDFLALSSPTRHLQFLPSWTTSYARFVQGPEIALGIRKPHFSASRSKTVQGLAKVSGASGLAAGISQNP